MSGLKEDGRFFDPAEDGQTFTCADRLPQPGAGPRLAQSPFDFIGKRVRKRVSPNNETF
jgi:hypothetical protein